MIVLDDRFGIRLQPRWARNDLEAHLRLGHELKKALASLCVLVPIEIPPEFTDVHWDIDKFNGLTQRERMGYFMEYALRLQRCYIFLIDALALYCRVTISSNRDNVYTISLYIEDKFYVCNYLKDHVCCLTWIVGKINFHIHCYPQKEIL